MNSYMDTRIGPKLIYKNINLIKLKIKFNIYIYINSFKREREFKKWRTNSITPN